MKAAVTMREVIEDKLDRQRLLKSPTPQVGRAPALCPHCHRPMPFAITIDPLNAADVVKGLVGERCHINPEILNSKKRDNVTAWVRQICFYLLRTHTPLSLKQIGNEFGGKDHGTVLHGVRLVESRMKCYPTEYALIKSLSVQFVQALQPTL